MINYKNHRLSLSSILVFCYCDEKAKQPKDYLHLLPRDTSSLNKKEIEKLVREGYELAVGLGLFSRHIKKNVVGGYIYKITKKGRERYDKYNDPNLLTENLQYNKT